VDQRRLSLNQYTVRPWSLEQTVAACVARDIPAIAVWRDKLATLGPARAARLLRDHGLSASSVCRGGFFPDPSPAERARRIDDTRRAIEEAAMLGAPTLVLVCGPAAGQSLADARAQVADGIAACLADAREAGIRLGIEALHPMMIAERSVIATLGEANDLATALGSPALGVIVDVYHVFWDVRVETEIARAGTTIAGFHLSDWRTPNGGDVTAKRAMIGDGCIDFGAFGRAVASAGYSGAVEIEILNEDAWSGDLDAWLDTAVERYRAIPDAAPLFDVSA
jgi:sugar phosphate isomerase/epimerase